MTLTAIQRVGRYALDGVVEVVLGADLWPKQVEVARALSKPNARVVVRACWASGKSFLGGRLPLAYYLTYPGGPGAQTKVVLTSSREDQLEDVLWSELRSAYSGSIIDIPGHLPPREMRLYANGDHYIVGHSPARPEGLKGYHAQHVLVVVDEGSYMPPDMGQAVLSLVSTGDSTQGTDARLLVLLNPSDSDSWAAQLVSSPHVTDIAITAFDTPGLSHLTNQEIKDRWGEDSLPPDRVPVLQRMPKGAALISPKHLDDMVARGNGPGSLEWETGVMARFWSSGSNKLVPPELYDQAFARRLTPPEDPPPSVFYFGIDIASYGDSESVIAIRQHPNHLRSIHARESMLPEDFLRQVAKPLFDQFSPSMVVYDADGPGAGVARLCRDLFGSAAFGFRGSMKYGTQFLNTRSHWWWKMRHRFLTEDIVLDFNDQTLRRQMTALKFDHNSSGQLKVEDKHSLHRRGFSSIDRADAVMYAFAHDTNMAERTDVSQAPREELWGRAARAQKKRQQSRSGFVPMPRGGARLPRR